jgi:hypothetical protein
MTGRRTICTEGSRRRFGAMLSNSVSRASPPVAWYPSPTVPRQSQPVLSYRPNKPNIGLDESGQPAANQIPPCAQKNRSNQEAKFGLSPRGLQFPTSPSLLEGRVPVQRWLFHEHFVHYTTNRAKMSSMPNGANSSRGRVRLGCGSRRSREVAMGKRNGRTSCGSRPTKRSVSRIRALGGA